MAAAARRSRSSRSPRTSPIATSASGSPRASPPRPAAISLADARVVVGGGRGVGSAEGFAELDELAALLGGAVGVSRVVTSAGWRPHAQQVGQTGTRIAPDLYIACGNTSCVPDSSYC